MNLVDNSALEDIDFQEVSNKVFMVLFGLDKISVSYFTRDEFTGVSGTDIGDSRGTKTLVGGFGKGETHMAKLASTKGGRNRCQVSWNLSAKG